MTDAWTPLLSVVVVSFETPELLVDCLAAVAAAGEALSEARGATCEVIVVDNGSRDHTLSTLRALSPAPRVVALPGNRGFAAASNVGLGAARGELILLLNSDACVDVRAFECLLAAFDADSALGIAGAQLVHPDGRSQNAGHAFPSLATELLPTGLLELALPRRYPSKRYAHATPYEVDAVQGAALIARRAVVERIGGLCEDFFFFLEETDWCKRARDAGFTVRVVPDARVVHLAGASSKRRDSARTRIEFHRSLHCYLRRHAGPRVERAVVCIRFLRALAGACLALPLLAFSPRARARCRDRWTLLVWYARGRPEDAGLEGRFGGDSLRAGSPIPGCAQPRV